MGKIGVFIFEGMTDFEITFAMHLLKTDGAKEVITFAYKDELINGKTGFTYKPTMVIDDVNWEELEGIIIPGGWFGDFREELLNLIRNLNDNGRLLCGICGAGTVALAKAGVLKNKKYTTPANVWSSKHKEVFGEEDPFNRENFILDRVIVDGNIITAQGIAFVDFALEICYGLKLFKTLEEKLTFGKTIKGN